MPACTIARCEGPASRRPAESPDPASLGPCAVVARGMSGAGEQPVMEVRIAEPGPLGLTFAVLKADDGPHHDFDLRLIADPEVLRSSDSLSGAALGGLRLDDALWVTSTGIEANTPPGEQFACRTVDGAARTLLVGRFSIALVSRTQPANHITTYSISELLEWCARACPARCPRAPRDVLSMPEVGWPPGACPKGRRTRMSS